MSILNHVGMGIWIKKKGDGLKDAVELYQQTKTTDGAVSDFWMH